MIERIDQERCTGCGLCVEICPMDVIRLSFGVDVVKQDAKKLLSRERKAYIAYKNDCMTCYNCELKCPVKAVEVAYPPFEKPFII